MPPDPLPVMLPEPIPPLLVPLELMLPELPPPDPTLNGRLCWAAWKLCSFSWSIAAFCEVSVPFECDERIACSDGRCTPREPVFSDWFIFLLPDIPALALFDCLALVEFMPFVELPLSFIPVFEVVAPFIPVFALPVLFIPVAAGPALLAPFVVLPLLFIPVVEPPLMLPAPGLLAELLIAPLLLAELFVAPVGLLWLLVAEFVADVPAADELSVVGSAAKAGAAASSPNAQTEASRRPLSMVVLPSCPVAEALGAARQMPTASHSDCTKRGERWRAARITSGCTARMS